IIGGPCQALLRWQVLRSIRDPLVDEVEITDTSPEYTHVKILDDRVITDLLRHLAPMAGDDKSSGVDPNSSVPQPLLTQKLTNAGISLEPFYLELPTDIFPKESTTQELSTMSEQTYVPVPVCRSERVQRAP
ncbi:hypothetical protein SK128_013480, partial [Halocaridina rubra]